MTVKIRLARGGSKKKPYYRIVISDVRARRDGRFIERVGSYNPLLAHDNENRVVLKKERVEYWLKVGAKPTDRVARFLDAMSIGNVKRAIPEQTKKNLMKAKARMRLEEAEQKVKEVQ